MEEIKPGEYVKTKDGYIGIFDRYSKRPNTSIYKCPFNCFIKLRKRKTPLQCSREYIVKHSKNIIDLIEVGDIVNESLIVYRGKVASEKEKLLVGNHIINGMSLEVANIKTILTKEQYMQNCFKLD